MKQIYLLSLISLLLSCSSIDLESKFDAQNNAEHIAKLKESSILTDSLSMLLSTYISENIDDTTLTTKSYGDLLGQACMEEEARLEKVEIQQNLKKAVTIVIKKKYLFYNYITGKSNIYFVFNLTNNDTTKTVNTIQFNLSAINVDGEQLLHEGDDYLWTCNKQIKAGKSIVSEFCTEYDPFEKKTVALNATDLGSLKTDCAIHSIVYTDGTSMWNK